MKLSIIVPAFNEERTISDVLKRLIKIKDIYEIVVVNDYSSDSTAEKVGSIKDKRIRLINHEKNRGKGAAVRTGLAAVDGDYVLIQDADSEYDPFDIPVMISPVERGRAEVVYGSRFFGIHTNMFYWHLLGNKFLNGVVNILYNSILSDMETGYKLLPTKLFRSLNLTSNDFRIEPEITCKLFMQGVKIMEVPISYVGRTYAEGKKITWKDGFGALKVILMIRFGGM